jgi:hypothetical protein
MITRRHGTRHQQRHGEDYLLSRKDILLYVSGVMVYAGGMASDRLSLSIHLLLRLVLSRGHHGYNAGDLLLMNEFVE